MHLSRNGQNPKIATLFPGPLCNLACTTCNDRLSTKWQAITGNKPTKFNPNITAKNLDWQGIQSVVVCGGEPVLHPSLPDIVEYTREHSIKLTLHFNGTVRPKQHLLDLVGQHQPKNVMFRISIDGIEEQFEYLRWPGKWDEFVQNVFWMRDNAPANVTFSFNFTQSVLNSERYSQVLDWINNEFSNKDNFKKNVPCGRQVAGAFNTQKSLSYFNRIDSQRNTNWKSCFPEVALKYIDIVDV